MDFHATLVVMAAGMGSRFGGLKQVAPVGPNGEAILDFSVYDAKQAGFNKVVFIIKKQIEEEFKRLVGHRVEQQIAVEYIFQETDVLPAGFTCPAARTKPWGTGHAVLCCKDVVHEPFAVINADDFYGAAGFRSIYNHLKETTSYCMVGFRLGNTITENGTVSRGVCHTENGLLRSITEHTKIDGNCRSISENGTMQLPRDTVVSMNMWGFTPDLFGYLERDFTRFLQAHIQDEKAEFFLPFVVDGLIRSGEKSVTVLTTEDKWYGVTYKEDQAAVSAAIAALCAAGKYNGLKKE